MSPPPPHPRLSRDGYDKSTARLGRAATKPTALIMEHRKLYLGAFRPNGSERAANQPRSIYFCALVAVVFVFVSVVAAAAATFTVIPLSLALAKACDMHNSESSDKVRARSARPQPRLGSGRERARPG